MCVKVPVTEILELIKQILSKPCKLNVCGVFSFVLLAPKPNKSQIVRDLFGDLINFCFEVSRNREIYSNSAVYLLKTFFKSCIFNLKSNQNE